MEWMVFVGHGLLLRGRSEKDVAHNQLVAAADPFLSLQFKLFLLSSTQIAAQRRRCTG
jgi:hypothetical protein